MKGKEQPQNKRVPSLKVKKDSNGTELVSNQNRNNVVPKCHFEFSLIKGFKLDTQGLDKEGVIEIIKSIFSMKRPIFWLLLSQAIGIIYIAIRNANLIVEAIKNFPEF